MHLIVRRALHRWQAAGDARTRTLEGMEEQHRSVFDSQAERSEVIFPGDSNSLGNLFGGRLMQFIDLVGAVAAYRHARSTAVVTASMDPSWILSRPFMSATC